MSVTIFLPVSAPPRPCCQCIPKMYFYPALPPTPPSPHPSYFSCCICQQSTTCSLALFMLTTFLFFHFLNPINFIMCLLESSSSTFSSVWNSLISWLVLSECLHAYGFWFPFHRSILVDYFSIVCCVPQTMQLVYFQGCQFSFCVQGVLGHNVYSCHE